MSLEKNEKRKDILENRLQEEVNKECTGNKKLKSIENKQLKINKHVAILKANKIKVMSHLSWENKLIKNINCRKKNTK